MDANVQPLRCSSGLSMPACRGKRSGCRDVPRSLPHRAPVRRRAAAHVDLAPARSGVCRGEAQGSLRRLPPSARGAFARGALPAMRDRAPVIFLYFNAVQPFRPMPTAYRKFHEFGPPSTRCVQAPVIFLYFIRSQALAAASAPPESITAPLPWKSPLCHPQIGFLHARVARDLRKGPLANLAAST